MSNPPLTVGLPVFNGERFLSHALDSILGQSFFDFRLVISDNASTDGTEAICREYASHDQRVVYLRNEINRGAAWNYNNVFAHCTTPYFRWSAADDLLAPTCLARCFEVLDAAPSSVAMCYPKTLIIGEDGEVVEPYDDNLDLRSPKPHVRLGSIVRTMVLGNPVFGVVRADTLRLTRGHGSFPSADYVLLVEIALRGEIWELPERLFFRRMHGGTSRQMNPTPAEYTAWHDPIARPVRHERLHLLAEYLAAVRHARLAPGEAAACYSSVVAAWTGRYVSVRRTLREMQIAIWRFARLQQ